NLNISDIVKNLIEEAFHRNASDIHIYPEEKKLRIRLRIDGLLVDIEALPKTIHQEVIARLKVLSSPRSDEHYKPQDGRFSIEIENQKLDIRISIVPTYYGENAVLRLL